MVVTFGHNTFGIFSLCWPNVFMVQGMSCSANIWGGEKTKQRHTVKQHWTVMVKHFISEVIVEALSHIYRH